MNLAVLVAVQDAGTALCGLLNGGYFARYWWHRTGTRSRRIGAAALSLVSGAAAVEAMFSQGLYWSQQGVLWFGGISPGVWALMRLPLFVATAVISAIVIRRLVS